MLVYVGELAKVGKVLWHNLEKMGLLNFPSAAEGVLHVLVMNTVLSVALLKNVLRFMLQVVGASGSPPNLADGCPGGGICPHQLSKFLFTFV